MLNQDAAPGCVTRAVVQYRKRLLLEALARCLATMPGFAVVGVTDRSVDVPPLCGRCRPDVVILEIEPAGPELLATVAELACAATTGAVGPYVVGLHETIDETPLVRFYQVNVHRLVSVGAGWSALEAALREAVAARQPGGIPGRLTDREHEVLTLVCAGCSAIQIGNALRISVHTAVNHKRRIFAKLGVQSRAQALAEAARLGLVDRDTVRSAWLLAVTAPGSRPVTLTGRERDILRSIACGHTVRQTAQALGIAIKTVQSEQRQLFSRLGAVNRAEALVLAGGLGLIDDDRLPLPALRGGRPEIGWAR